MNRLTIRNNALRLSLAQQGPAGAAGTPGDDGREVELGTSETHIQWRVTGGSWANLVALADITGPQGPAGGGGASVPVGTRITGYWPAAPTGYVLADGGSIGNASSGATRANADTQALFSLLWTMWETCMNYSATVPNVILADSSGAPVAYGASAAADFEAGKRLTLPDERLRVAVGADMGQGFYGTGTAAPGASGGEASHTLTEAEIPAHSHDVAAAMTGTFDSNGDGSTGGALQDSYQVPTAPAGGGGAHNNVQPFICVQAAIKL